MPQNNNKISKSDALKICEKCKKKDPKGCIRWDVEEHKDDTITIPACMRDEVSNIGHPTRKKLDTNEEKLDTNEDLYTKNASDTESVQLSDTPNEKSCTPMVVLPPAEHFHTNTCTLKLSTLDKEILSVLTDDLHVRGIARELNRPASTISYRLKRLVEAKLLISSNGVYGTKLYKISKDLHTQINESLIHNEERKQEAEFTAHAMSFKYPLVGGVQPQSKNSYKMRNWTGYVFTFNNYAIRSTPQSIIIDVNMALGAGSINDLNAKYMDMAQSYIVGFAKQYKLKLGAPQHYRDPHYTIEDTAIGKILTERGEFKTRGMGLNFDISKSKGDAEMGEKSARAFEFTLNQLPGITDKINSNLKDLNKTATEEFGNTTETLEKINENVTGLYIMMQMKNELDKLREDYKEMLEIIKSQNDVQKASPEQQPMNKNELQLYG